MHAEAVVDLSACVVFCLVLVSHTKPSPASHLLLPRAPRRGHWSLRRVPLAFLVVTIAVSPPLSPLSRGTGYLRHPYPREWIHLLAALSSSPNVSADFSPVCHLQDGPPQYLARSSWISIDVEKWRPAHQHQNPPLVQQPAGSLLPTWTENTAHAPVGRGRRVHWH